MNAPAVLEEAAEGRGAGFLPDVARPCLVAAGAPMMKAACGHDSRLPP